MKIAIIIISAIPLLLLFVLCSLLSLPFLMLYIAFSMWGEEDTGFKIMEYSPIALLQNVMDRV